MKNYFTLIFIVFLSASTSLQGQDLTWAKGMGSTSGDNSYGIVVDNEGNSYSVGSFSLTADFDPGPGSYLLTTNGVRDIYISKLDVDGDFVWAKHIGGELSDAALSIAFDQSGYIYVTGNFRDTVDFDPSGQDHFLYGRDKAETFLAKFDLAGKLMWAQQVTRSLDTLGIDAGYSVQVDPQGNVYVLGRFSFSADFDPGNGDQILTSAGQDDNFLAKYDAVGNFIWAKSFGGPEDEDAYSMAIDHQGNIFCTGTFSGEADFDPGPLTHLLVEQDSMFDAFILKLNPSGEFIWAKQISGPDIEYSNGITVDPNGNCYTAGACTSRTDFNYGGNPVFLTVTGDADGYILSLDSDGTFRWVKQIGGLDYQEAWGITSAPGPKGGVYTTGYFLEEAVVNNAEIPGITANGNIDVFISKLDFEGNFKFLVGISGTGLKLSQAIAVNSSTPDAAIYSTGYFSMTCDFDPGIDEYPLTSAGSTDVYVIKLNDLTTGIENVAAHETGMNIQVYPNPADDAFDIKFPDVQKAKLKITNSQGLEIKSFETRVENETLHVNISSFPTGIYFVQLAVNEKLITKKIMVSH